VVEFASEVKSYPEGVLVMTYGNPSDDEIRVLLTSVKTVAMVGASDKPERPSNGVMAFLLSKGIDVIPVNPGLAGKRIHGKEVYDSLAPIKAPVDMVDIFRASEFVAPIVDEAIAIGAKSVWMQLGIIDETAAAKARSAGLKVVMDRCPKIEWSRLGLK
jgi:uncharacterized protein